MANTFKIPVHRLGELNTKIGFLNRKAKKLGCAEIVVTLGKTFTVSFEEGTKTVTYQEVTVEGLTPKINGWSFVGTIDTNENGNIFRNVPGKEIPESYRYAKTSCDHCKTNRYRKDIFIIQHDDGSFKQIGRQCLQDFLGRQSPQHIAALCEYLLVFVGWGEDDDDYSRGWSNGWCYPSLKCVLAQTVAICQKHGWVSKGKGTEPTVDQVRNHFNPKWAEDNKKYFIPTTPSDKEYAQKIIDWINTQEKSSNSFVRNLYFAFQSEAVEERNMGLVAASYISYEKAVEHMRKKSETKPSEHFGEVGKREVFILTVTGFQVFDADDYGRQYTSTMVRFKDDNGNNAVWFASGVVDGWNIGDKIEVKATVKKHDVYKDNKQTMLQRVSFLKTIKAAEPKKCEICGTEVFNHVGDRGVLCLVCAEKACEERY